MPIKNLLDGFSSLLHPRPEGSPKKKEGENPNVAPSLWFLEVARFGNRFESIPIDKTPYVIGRDDCCNLQIRDTEISRRHAEIIFQDGVLFLQDQDSKNGTFVNRARIQDITEVRAGDILHFGTIEYRLNCQTGSDAPTPACPRDDVESTVLLTISNPETDLTGKFVAHEAQFLEMLQRSEIDTHFQPILEIQSQRVIGYEVLGRGIRSDFPREPCKLFEIADKLGRAIELSERFRIKGVELARQFPESPLLFLNTYPGETLTSGLDTSLRDLRQMAPACRIAIEIHESAVTDLPMMKELKGLLAELDMLLAYDDFGAGLARLNELTEVPPDFLKFDASLIRNIHLASDHKRSMVSRLVDLAKDMGTECLAECVETVEEIEVCRDLGFTYVQGYYYAKPAPLSHFLED